MKRTAPLLVLLATLIQGSLSLAAEPVTLRVADQKGNMRAQLEASDALKALPYQIQWAEFPAAAPLAEALNAGAVDIGIIGDAPLLFALAAGAPLKAVAVNVSDPYGTALLVLKDSPLQSAAELKGKRIATGRGSIGHFVALKALEQAGLTAQDVEFRFLGPVDARTALSNGSVDAWSTWEPYTALAESSGQGRVLVNGRGLWSGNSYIAATDQALADPARSAAIQDYLQRLNGAQQWAYGHVDEYAKTLAQIIGFPEQAARLSFARRAMHWQALNAAVIAQQQATADFYHRHGLLTQPLEVRNTFDQRFQITAIPLAEALPAQQKP